MIKRVKLEKVIVCRGEGIIVGVEKKISREEMHTGHPRRKLLWADLVQRNTCGLITR
jgi:hypothetical protein